MASAAIGERKRDGRRLLVAALVILAGLILLSGRPLADEPPRRMALVIGQSQYLSATRLPNAANDATDIAKALREAKFEVTEVHNLKIDEFEPAISRFVRGLRPGDAVLVYYAGHGIQAPAPRASDGMDNYLIPTDAELETPDRVGVEAVALGSILERINLARPGPVVVILDACRNNPFARRWRSQGRDVPAGGGLAQPSIEAMRGVFLAYATAPGEIASENPDGRNGLFTQELLKHLTRPGQTVGELFGEVSASVEDLTGGEQRPWSSSAGRAARFMLVPGASPRQTAAPVVSPSERDREFATFTTARQVNSIAAYEDYLRRFPDGENAAMARAALATLKPTLAAPSATPPAALGPITEQQRARGMSEAPPLAKAAGIDCLIVEARYVGINADRKADYFEIACERGLGYILESIKGQAKPTLYLCFGTTMCRLRRNLNPQAQLPYFVAKAGRSCVIEESRYIGASATKAYVEIGCQDGNAYVMALGMPVVDYQAQFSHCLSYDPGTTLECKLSARDAQLAAVDTLLAMSGKACAPTGRRYVLSTVAGENWFEAACGNGSGFMVEQLADGRVGRVVGCADAGFVGGGCKLIDATLAQADKKKEYGRRVAQAGFTCDVETYGRFNVADKEVVELKCGNRPDGAVAVFEGDNAVVFGCARALAQGYRCTFTDIKFGLDQVSRDLAALSVTCAVEEVRPMAKATEDDVFLEARCKGGARHVISYPRGSAKAKDVRACAAAEVLGGCKLATRQ